MNRIVGIFGIVIGLVYLINSFEIEGNRFLIESAKDTKQMITKLSTENPKINTETLKKISKSIEHYNSQEVFKTNAIRITSAMLIIVSLLLVLKGKVRVTR